MKSSVVGIIKLVRFPTFIFIGLIVFIPFFINSGLFLFSLFVSVPFMFAAMFGFAVNDYFDFKKDMINKPNRALPQKLLSIKQVKIIVYILFVLSIASILIISQSSIDYILYFLALIGVLLYNLVVKNAAVLKTIMTAFICIIPIVFTCYKLGNNFVAIFLSIIAYIYILGREIRMDIYDYIGDMQAGNKTIPVIIGIERSKAVSSILIYLSLLSFCCLAFFISKELELNLIVISIIVISQILCELLWKKRERSLQRMSILLNWVPMLTGCFFCLLS